jgi:hypothetical protein
VQQPDQQERYEEADVDALIAGTDGDLDAPTEQRAFGELVTQAEPKPMEELTDHGCLLERS